MPKRFRPLSTKFKLIRFLWLIIFFPFIRKIRGFGNLLKDKAFIVASNHGSIMDGLLLTVYLSRPINRHLHYISKAKYYKNRLFRLLMETAENIKMEDGTPARALLVALEYLRHGEIVALFPEGTRSYDGKIRRAESGVAALALLAKVPVVPVGTLNTYKILPRGKLFLRYARCEINIGKALEFEEYYKAYDEAIQQKDQAKIKEIEETVLRRIMEEIAKLSNQEYPY